VFVYFDIKVDIKPREKMINKTKELILHMMKVIKKSINKVGKIIINSTKRFWSSLKNFYKSVKEKILSIKEYEIKIERRNVTEGNNENERNLSGSPKKNLRETTKLKTPQTIAKPISMNKDIDIENAIEAHIKKATSITRGKKRELEPSEVIMFNPNTMESVNLVLESEKKYTKKNKRKKHE